MEIVLAAFLAGMVLVPAVEGDGPDGPGRVNTAQVRQAVSPPPRPLAWRAAATTLDLGSVATICRAARDHTDPAGFVDRLSRAYGLSPAELQSLQSSCAAWRAAGSDAH
ncbi:MAG: hypothetical protein ACXWUP_11080 [Allosphingosinicella sp.]